MAPRVQTVLKDVSPESLGRTLTHEHLAMEFEHFYRKPPKFIDHYVDLEISLSNVGFVRQYPYSNRKNLKLNDVESKQAVLEDVKLYKKYGGGTIVENSTEGLGRDIKYYNKISVMTGVNIVAGTGYYIEDVQSADVLNCTEENMYDHMIKELIHGCDNTSIKAGFIGEVASVWPLRDFERKAIRAAGHVQSHVYCGVSFHPHRHPEAPFEIIRLYLEAGGKADKAVMSHLDRTLLEPEQLLEFSELGTYCQLDLFGVEVSFYQLNMYTDMPSDAQRIQMIKHLLENGKKDKILMSHDIHTKHRLTSYGGHGYGHIFTTVLPQMKLRGIEQSIIDDITIGNPATWLTMGK